MDANAQKCCVVCNIAFGPNTKRLHCSRCHEKSGIACYCSRSCQRRHWPAHKIVCFDDKTTTIVQIDASEGNTISSIQAVIDGAPADSVIIIPEGRFKASNNNDDDKESIVINKPIKILGNGIGRTALECDFHVLGNKNTSSSLVIARLAVEGTIKVDVPPAEAYEKVTFLAVRAVPRLGIEVKAFSGDRFHIKSFPRKELLLLACEIIGGQDGIVIGSGVPFSSVIIQETEISHATCRGIFATPSFTIKNSKVHSCGAYGIKGRSGWREVGDNEIQPGPWSACPY